MNDDLLTVRQYARLAGVSWQSVYKRIKHGDAALQPYIVEQDNGKGKPQIFLKKDLLTSQPTVNQDSQPVNLEQSTDQPKVVNQSTETVNQQPIWTEKQSTNQSTSQPKQSTQAVNQSTGDSQPVNQDSQPSQAAETPSDSPLVAHLLEEVEYLKGQLATKDRQIESLLQSLQTEQVKAARLTARLTAPEDQEERRADPEIVVDLAQEEDHAVDQRQEQPKRRTFLEWWHDLWS